MLHPLHVGFEGFKRFGIDFVQAVPHPLEAGHVVGEHRLDAGKALAAAVEKVGASSRRDGHHCAIFPANGANTPVEIFESDTPLIVAERSLAVGRAKQRNIDNWQRPGKSGD